MAKGVYVNGCVCMSACLRVCMSACLRVCMSACLHVCMSACLRICVSACLRVCVPACLHLLGVPSLWCAFGVCCVACDRNPIVDVAIQDDGPFPHLISLDVKGYVRVWAASSKECYLVSDMQVCGVLPWGALLRPHTRDDCDGRRPPFTMWGGTESRGTPSSSPQLL